ncbi:MAG: rubrerythrin family protein [Thermodesulfobacteriota bacterium]
MEERSEKNLAASFASESQAAARNQAFAQKADHEGNTGTARLFRALAEAESVQARRYLMILRGKIGSTRENLEAARRRVNQTVKETYPLMIEEAGKEGLTNVETAFTQTLQAKTSHETLIEKNSGGQSSERDPDYYVCQICGFISESRAPERCPICGAIPGKFKLIG